MSDSLELYRTTVNLRGLGVGTLIEIDPEDSGWAGDIAAKRIVPANVATSESYVTDDDEPVRLWSATDDPLTAMALENGRGEDGWPVPAPRGGFPTGPGFDWSGS